MEKFADLLSNSTCQCHNSWGSDQTNEIGECNSWDQTRAAVNFSMTLLRMVEPMRLVRKYSHSIMKKGRQFECMCQ